jgi:beta-N-acetylhexosaminidase
MVAEEVARKSITLARDTRSLVPLTATARRILSITYANDDDVIAGRIFNEALRGARRNVRAVSVDSRTTKEELDRLKIAADSADLVIASLYVMPRESRGSIGTEGGFPAFLQQLAAAQKSVVAVSFGSPYVISAFPDAPTYLLAWGGAPVSQRAAAAALLGNAPISGRLPISIPPSLKAGDGIDRAAVKSAQ